MLMRHTYAGRTKNETEPVQSGPNLVEVLNYRLFGYQIRVALRIVAQQPATGPIPAHYGATR